MKRVESFEHACELLGYEPASVLPDVSKMPESLQQYTLASIKRVIIAEAIKEGKHPQPGDWFYEPWFRFTSASGFSFHDDGCALSLSYVGSRLCFNTREEARYFGENFTELHKAVMLG